MSEPSGENNIHMGSLDPSLQNLSVPQRLTQSGPNPNMPLDQVRLFAVILGEPSPSDRVFSITSPLKTQIADWKRLVKQEQQPKLDYIAASHLSIWKLKKPILIDKIDDLLAPDVTLLDIGVKLGSADDIGEHFKPDEVDRKYLYIIVQVPFVQSAGQKRNRSLDDTTEPPFKRLCREREQAFKDAKSNPPPSIALGRSRSIQAQAGNTILNGRPFYAVGPPITIYEPIFSEFRAMNEGKKAVDVSPEDYRHAKEFMVASSKIYMDDAAREAGITGPLRKLLHRPLPTVKLEDNTSEDGIIRAVFKENPCLLLIREIRNEMGINGDPFIQVGYSYTRWWASLQGSYFRDRTCCPSFLPSIAGPWVCVQGGILTGRSWTVQPLTDLEWTGVTIDIDGQASKVARLFCSLTAALKALEGRFEKLNDTPKPSLPPCFPFITSYISNVTREEEVITYENRLHYEEGREATTNFSATVNNGEAVFIKFVTRYNRRAHELLAENGYAPRLRYLSELQDGATHFMVVMDRLDGHDMYEEIFQADDLNRVRMAKTLLHENGYVFGDLRPNNIFKPKNGPGVMLVDFDWCGKADEDRYPPTLNDDPRCNWHSEVRGGGIMRKSHDDHLFDSLRHS